MTASHLARSVIFLCLVASGHAARAAPPATAPTRPTTRPATTRSVEVKAEVIDVNVANFAWTFKYATGKVSNDLHLSAGRDVEFRLTSGDVIHSMLIPELRVKWDAVPGRIASVKVSVPPDAAKLSLHCAELCGVRHESCGANVVVHDRAAFDAWLSDKPKP
jgi:cytochrome c oxidase subunit II